ncbi:hypothetical protein SDC9_41226 [bioreactor metagenome]|uniref:Calcineurin-like phosphoesterase domain-containing protein n=1 Tax=bioreactor metagenome TaxID=1076179 RepID=A0A644VXL5_9ZZZZ
MILRQRDPDDDTEWSDVADWYNKQTGQDVTRCTVRKGYFLLAPFLEAGMVNPYKNEGTSESDDLRAQRLELEKERIRLRDERNENSRIIRELARKDATIDIVKNVISETVEPHDGFAQPPRVPSDTDMIVHLTDIHAGIQIDNFANQYDSRIMNQRLQAYLSRIAEIQKRHKSESCYLLLGGDLISGIIHSNLRLENNLNVIEQVKAVSLSICEFIKTLSSMFSDVNVYSVPGNHSRCLPNKEDNLKGENLDVLVFFYAQAALQQYENVYFFENDVEESVAIFRVRSNLVYGVHGDKDTISSVVQRLTMFFGEKPDIVLAGHRHTNGLTTVFDTKVVESGCLVGADNYCMDKRLRNKPEQMVLVVSEDGLECLYDVKLN